MLGIKLGCELNPQLVSQQRHFHKTKIPPVNLDLVGHRAQPNQKGFFKGGQKIDFLENPFFAPP